LGIVLSTTIYTFSAEAKSYQDKLQEHRAQSLLQDNLGIKCQDAEEVRATLMRSGIEACGEEPPAILWANSPSIPHHV